MNPSDSDELRASILARLDAIETRLRALEMSREASVPPEANLFEAAGQDTVSAIADTPITPSPPIEPLPPAATPPEPEPREKPLGFESAFGLTWLNRAGVLTFVLGVTFFFKYAVDNRLIGEWGRVLLGLAAGCGALLGAEWMWRRGHRVYAQGITGAGIAIVYVALYASYALYQLVPLPLAFLSLAVDTVLAVALSLRYRSWVIAALGLAGGYLTPLVLDPQASQPWALTSYTVLLGAGGMWLVRQKAWRWLEPLVLIGGTLVYIFGHVPGKPWWATAFALALYALFPLTAGLLTVLGTQALTTLELLGAGLGDSHFLWIALVVAASGLAVAHYRNWPRLAAVSFVVYWSVSTMWVVLSYTTPGTPWLAISYLSLAFLGFLSYSAWRLRHEGGEWLPPLLGVLASDGLLYFGLLYSLLNRLHHSYMGLLATALAAVYIILAWWLKDNAAGERRPMMLSAGVAAALLTLAVPIQFSQFRITIAWALEAAAFTWIAFRTGHQRFGVAALVLFALAFSRILFADAWMYPNSPVYYVRHALFINARFFTFLITGVCCWMAARWMLPGAQALSIYLAGHVAVLWGLLLEAMDWAHGRGPDYVSVSTVTASVLLAAYGVTLVTLGVRLRSFVNRTAGLVLLVVVVMKLYVYDVWQLQQTFRVIAFIVLGLLLLLTSFLYSRFRGLVERLWEG